MNKPKTRTFLWMFPLVLVFALIVFGIGVFHASQRADFALLSAGCISVFAVLGLWCLALVQHAHNQGSAQRLDELLSPVNERLQQINVLLNMVSEQQLISERAKTIAFRETERDTLRRAIREEISHKDYDAALVLVNDIERIFGYKVEADRFREEINRMRQDEARRAIGDVANQIDRYCRAEEWNLALREAERAMAQYPFDGQVQALPQEIESRRQAHKRQLLDSWNDAVARHDVDGSVEILKQLDAYLTPAEAQEMQETARRILKDRLQLMGQQFTLAVKEHRWSESVEIGQMLINEYPNSRMAQEVREKIELLRQRASSPQAAEV